MITVYGIETTYADTADIAAYRRNVMITVYGIETIFKIFHKDPPSL